MKPNHTSLVAAPNWRARLASASLYPIAGIAFFMPGEMAPINICAVLTIAIWLITPGIDNRWQTLRSHPVFWAMQAYFWLMVVGLIWTDDVEHGLSLIDHALPLAILTPPLLTLIRADRYEPIISAYLAGIALCVVLAHYNWLRMHLFTEWPLGFWVDRSPGDTAPFVDRVTYAPLLAWAAYLSARRVVATTGFIRLIYAVLTLAVISNLMFSGGRAGMAAFAALLVLFFIQQMRDRRALGVVIGLGAGLLIFGSAYLTLPHFQERLHLALEEVSSPQKHVNGAVSERMVMGGHALHLFSQSPIIGLGTGDYKNEYTKRHNALTPQWRIYTHPHNQFLYTATITGVIGLVLLLLVYFPLGLFRLPIGDGRDDLRIALPIWISVISLFGSYLWRSQTSMFLVLFTCVAWAAVSRTSKR